MLFTINLWVVWVSVVFFCLFLFRHFGVYLLNGFFSHTIIVLHSVFCYIFGPFNVLSFAHLFYLVWMHFIRLCTCFNLSWSCFCRCYLGIFFPFQYFGNFLKRYIEIGEPMFCRHNDENVNAILYFMGLVAVVIILLIQPWSISDIYYLKIVNISVFALRATNIFVTRNWIDSIEWLTVLLLLLLLKWFSANAFNLKWWQWKEFGNNK